MARNDNKKVSHQSWVQKNTEEKKGAKLCMVLDKKNREKKGSNYDPMTENNGSLEHRTFFLWGGERGQEKRQVMSTHLKSSRSRNGGGSEFYFVNFEARQRE